MFVTALWGICVLTPPLVSQYCTPQLQEQLRHAIAIGDEAAVRQALARGAQVESADANGVTPLMNAATGHYPPVVERLIASGAQVRRRGPAGMTALHFAAYSGDARTAAMLLRAGADPNALTDAGDTPSDIAVERESYDVVRLLRASGGWQAAELANEPPAPAK
jgi:ankyrin repeat protein